MGLDLKSYDFPEPSLATPTDPALLAEALERGFGTHNNPYNRLFSTLFFRGGAVTYREGLDTGFRAKAIPYLKSLMGSFEPRHEDKEAVCAMLLSELVVLEHEDAA